jgi:hypothetical protein
MANPGEVLINVGTLDKRKMLTRLGQKARGQVQVLLTHLSQMTSHRPQRHSLTHSGTDAKRGKPVVLHSWEVNRKVS